MRPSVTVRTKSGFRSTLTGVVSALTLGGVAGCGFLPISAMSFTGTQVIASTPKPPPTSPPFHGCAPEGLAPDHPLNRHKNRTDTAKYLSVNWGLIARLPWPRQVGYRFRNQWTPTETRQVARFEGAAVRVEGFVIDTKLEGPETTNCGAADSASADYHLWLAEEPNHKQRLSVVVEITPRVRANHPRWTHRAIEALASSRRRVRLSGWLLLDQLHPGEVGGSRATLWEVHPVMRVEWLAKNGRWISLDSLSPSPTPPSSKRVASAP